MWQKCLAEGTEAAVQGAESQLVCSPNPGLLVQPLRNAEPNMGKSFDGRRRRREKKKESKN